MSDNEEIDNWSLKGVDIPAWGGVVHVYTQTSMEIIRQKLLDDIGDAIIKHMAHIDLVNEKTKLLLFEEVERKINKRFGVEK